jgi:hypothetical protein
MLLMRTSGSTLGSVVKNCKHASKNEPKGWYMGELILISKNKKPYRQREKQIQYIMKIKDIRPLLPGEAERYWPGNEGRWRYLIDGENCIDIVNHFDLKDLLDDESKNYNGVVCFKKILPSHETIIMNYLKSCGIS